MCILVVLPTKMSDTKDSSAAMKYEDVYEYIGQIGRYQWYVVSIVCVFHMLSCEGLHIVFIGDDMDHWCHVDELDGLPYDVQKNVAIPTETSKDGMSTVYSSCKMFTLNYSVYNTTEFETWNRTEMISDNVPVVSCDRWSYDQSTFQSTIVKTFDLVCGRNVIVQLASTLFMAGVLLGSLSSGLLSDKIGRKKTMLLYCSTKVCGNLMSMFGSHYSVFLIGRFVIGFCQVGYYLPSYALVMEFIGPKYRSLINCVLQTACAAGIAFQPGIAYFLRDEFTYQLGAAGPTFLFPFVIFVFVPESTRWLIIHGRYDEAMKQIQLICRVNRVELPPSFDLRKIETEVSTKKRNCLALLTSPVMRLRTILIDCSWFTCSLIYDALALNTGALYGNIYLNLFLSGALEVPACILPYWMIDRKCLGRRLSTSLSLLAGGFIAFMCIPLILLNFDIQVTALCIIGKAVITLSFNVVYVYASEIFPTEVRSVGMGTGNMFSRIASMAASFVGGPLAHVWKPLPSLVFGTFATLSGLSLLLMPETLGQPLPDTISEVEQNSRKMKARSTHRTNCFSCRERKNGDSSDMMADESAVRLSTSSPVLPVLTNKEVKEEDCST